MKKIILAKIIPKLKTYTEKKILYMKKTEFFDSIFNYSEFRLRQLTKQKFLKWHGVAFPVREKKNIVKIINSFTYVRNLFLKMILDL